MVCSLGQDTHPGQFVSGDQVARHQGDSRANLTLVTNTRKGAGPARQMALTGAHEIEFLQKR
jgi:hypothetical protein